MTDYTKKINKRADIYCADGYVIVTDGKNEIFRKPKNTHTVAIAHSVYMATKYGECNKEN